MSEDDAAKQAELLTKIAAGDLEALGEFWPPLAPRVLRFVAHRLRRPIDDPAVEDVASETLERVLSRAASYQGDAKPLTWVLGIAKNVMLERLKEPEIVADATSGTVRPADVEPDQFPVPFDELESLLGELQADLTPAQRKAMIRETEHSVKEEAREGLHGRDAAAHRQNVHRARESMMKRITTDDRYERLRPWLTS